MEYGVFQNSIKVEGWVSVPVKSWYLSGGDIIMKGWENLQKQ